MNSKLLPEEKLEIIRAADTRRKWHSLDDHRICVLCDRTITGRQIEVARGPGGTYSVHCPTPGCVSLPTDWFYQGNASSASRPVIRNARSEHLEQLDLFRVFDTAPRPSVGSRYFNPLSSAAAFLL